MNYLKRGWLLLLMSLPVSFLNGQGLKTIDKLKQELNQPLSDTAIVVRLATIGYQYAVIKPDSSVYYLTRALEMSRKINYKYGEALAMSNFGWVYRQKSDYKEAINILNKCNKIESGFPFIIASNLLFRAYIDFDLQEYSLAKEKAIKARDIFKTINESHREVVSAMVLIDILNVQKKYDAALKEAKDLYAYTFSNKIVGPYGIVSIKLARAYLKMGMTDSASRVIDESFNWGKSTGNTRVVIFSQQLKAEMFSKKNEIDSAILYAQHGYETSIKEGFLSNALELSEFLVQLFSEKKNKDAAFQYEQIASQLKDSVYGLSKMTALQKLIVDQQNESFAIKEQNASLQNSRRQKLLIIIGSFFVIFSLLITWAYNKIRKEKSITEAALMQLKSTQTQLIHAEKMASLGELTAGIAHEIQNPLNFVNNFSQISTELTKEMVDEFDKGNTEEVKAIAGDLIGNLEKINHHGQRASDIVKGMLQHSRSSSGTKEPTDINALCDEYLRLAYHGLRAKDKTFNAKFQTSFDDSIGKINVMPQEMGRVILNLINNGFYAVSEKRKLSGESYKPEVIVSTKKNANSIEIKVSDNGTGIPKKTVEKIFQPFFTTKPTGQGTGLGLSLSYDIVKAHGGELTVETKEGEGSTFTIFLPIVQA